jgi:mannosyl-3-phosphoglycerate phosphatase family protein
VTANPHAIIYTDIDGTLIELETYGYAASAAAVARLVRHGVPVVLCSSKTRVEQEELRQVLGIPDPFIVENGSAVVVPPGYFPLELPGEPYADGSQAMVLGVSADWVRLALQAACAKLGLFVQGYGDLSVAEVAETTGLDLEAAARARRREYSETIVTPLSPRELEALNRELARDGLVAVSGGRFHTVTARESDKGEAVRLLSGLFRRQLGDIVTIGIGDSANDLPLLAAVDRAYLVQRPDGTWQDTAGLAVTRVPGIGPLGWRQVAGEIVQP